MNSGPRIRLSSLLLLLVVLGLFFCLFLQKRRERELQSAILPYRDQAAEAIFTTLDQPLALTYPDGTPLQDALKNIRLCSTGPKLLAGLQIYVDPFGLATANQTMKSPVKKPRDQSLTLREHLSEVLKSLGLGFAIRGRGLVITSEDAVHLQPEDDPYLGFRDVLKE